MNAAVLARRNIEADGVAVVHHHPVGSEIDPLLFRIPGDVEASGADVAAAVVRVPLRRRQLQHVHVVAHHHVLEDRTVRHFLVRDRLQLTQVRIEERFGQLDLAVARRKTERHVFAFSAEKVDEHPMPLGIAGYLVEDHARSRVRMHDEVGGEADFLLP